MSYPILTTLIFVPLAAAFLLMVLPMGQLAVRRFTLWTGFAEIALAIPLLTGFSLSEGGFQFVEHMEWVPQWGLSYSLAVDGISLLMVLLSVLLLPLTVLCSWTYIEKRIKEFHFCLLLMTAACVGVFAAMDLVLFYVFWEAMLIPMYLLIAVWGGPEKRYASIKFFLYTLAGSTLLLAAIVALYYQGGTFSIPELLGMHFPAEFQTWVFLAMALAFAIKVPMFPFHTWLPAAHVQAPAAGSVLLASVLLKMGTYGFLRFCLPICPDASQFFAPAMIAISVISIIYGGLVALGQNDIKRIIAYSSVAHMGFVTLGIFLFNQEGAQGAVMVMLNHGIVTGALFMMVGLVYERSHSRDLSDNLGLGKFMPAYMGFFGLFALSSFGFPGLNSFVGEALVLIAAFASDTVTGLIVIPGALLAAAYMLRLGLKMAWGRPASPKDKGWADLNKREWAYLAPLAVLVFYIGLAPGLTLRVITPSVDRMLQLYETKTRQTAQMEQQAPARPKLLALSETTEKGE
ncbi:complex I subunit 4 family protein [Salidesulfovibrio onnuriiensis]|uniref:complex I subunit 4 family protein n=1 Tax=Salidesulfovibrio onnuriiensis TaxID=2583823 RepID=UPI0011CBF70E|nr:NADH-quinone oxidoreductase subunit M [Salidesulfovibrio onnuriiensis]